MANTTISNDAEPSCPLVAVSLSNILKLTNTNNLSWKLQIQATLIGYGLFKFLDGSHPAPPATLTKESAKSPNPAATTWLRQDQLLFGALIGTLDTTIVPLVSRASTAKEAWDILAHTFARQSRGPAKLLKANFRLLTKGAQSVSEYMNVVRVCADQLAILGEPVQPEDLIDRILEGLQDPNYKSLIDAVNARYTLITFDELYEKLLVREGNLRTETPLPTTPLPATALAATTRYPPPSSSQPHDSSPRPYHPHKPPYTPSKKISNSKGQGYQGKCQWCHVQGHSLYRCHKFQQAFPNAKPTLPPSSTSPQANLAVAPPIPSSPTWLLDSGASYHVTNDLSNLALHHPYDGSEEIVIGNGMGIPISHIGSLCLPTASKPLKLNSVLCAPSMARNIISISQLCSDNNLLIGFSPDSFNLKDPLTGAHLIRGPTSQGIYELPTSSSILALSTVKAPAIDWHHRLGHPSLSIFKNLVSQFKLSVTNSLTFNCEACQCNKSHKLPFCQSTLVSSYPLELIYTDLWTSPLYSRDGFKYYVIFVDHFTKYIWFYPLKHKSDTKSVFIMFKALLEKYFERPIKTLYSDNGSEYEALFNFLTIDGVSHLTSPPYTPEHNGFAERRHRHIVETGLSLLSHAHLPPTFWTYAFTTASYLINRLPTPTLNGKSPFHCLFGKPPNYLKLPQFWLLMLPMAQTLHFP